VETVDSAKLASLLNTAWASAAAPAPPPRRLDVYVQVNTSGEMSKHGVAPAEAPALARHVRDACPHLRLSGLMTIGQPDYTSRPENFASLRAAARAVAGELGWAEADLELSMGMSGDFEAAIEMGSTNGEPTPLCDPLGWAEKTPRHPCAPPQCA
jgi:uncharacterized pyridoxal phosphate-containing UPF0001 family protein